MIIHTMQTGRKYAREGQVIAWAILAAADVDDRHWNEPDNGRAHVAFYDVSRGIGGCTVLDVYDMFGGRRSDRDVEGDILAAYDGGRYNRASTLSYQDVQPDKRRELSRAAAARAEEYY